MERFVAEARRAAAALGLAVAVGIGVGCTKAAPPVHMASAVHVGAEGLDAVVALPEGAAGVRWLAVSRKGEVVPAAEAAAVHVYFELVPAAWEALDDEAGGPPAAAAALQVRDDIGRALLPSAALAAAPLEGPWRRVEGPKYELRDRVKPPFRSESGVRLGGGLYFTVFRRP